MANPCQGALNLPRTDSSPVNRQVRQSPFHHLAPQFLGALPDERCSRQSMLVGTIGLSLGPDTLVKNGDGRVGQSFQTHSAIPFRNIQIASLAMPALIFQCRLLAARTVASGA